MAGSATRPLVLHLIGAIHGGGAERQLVDFVAASSARGRFRHAILCLGKKPPPSPLPRELSDHGVPVDWIRVRDRAPVTSFRRLRAHLLRVRPQVLHCHMHYAGFWGRLAATGLRIPVTVVSEHGKELWKPLWRVHVDHLLSRYRTTCHIAVSRDIRDIRISRERVDPERIVVIPNGVSLARLSSCSPPPEFPPGWDQVPGTVIGTVGRFVEAKAYDVLVESLALLQAQAIPVRWLALGDGPLRPSIQSLLETRGLSRQAFLMGSVDNVPRWLPTMDIWVMSSIREGVPVALLEAMAASRPIVATRVGGIPEVITDMREGLLVPPRSPEALASALERLIRDSELRARLAATARYSVEREFDITLIAARIDDLYDRHLRRFPKSAENPPLTITSPPPGRDH